MIFYAVNTFTFGNGPYGSKLCPNLHGLRHFLKRAPKNHLSGIEKVNVLLHCRTVTHVSSHLDNDIGTMTDVKDLHSTVQALAKHFTSLKTIVFQYYTDSPE